MKVNTVARCLCPGVFLLLAGCTTLKPSYTRPLAPVAASWPAPPLSTEPVAAPAVNAPQTDTAKPQPQPVADIPWQEFFSDGVLRRLVELALKNNRDLQVAALNIERSRALYQIQRSELLPRIDATGGAVFQRIAEDLSSSGRAMTVEQYSVGLGFSAYELDLFGRVSSLKDQALEQYLATGYARRSLQISLVSQVAAAYLSLAADQERLQLARETLASQRSSFELTKSRFEAGISTALDLNQARSSVDAARVDIARYATLVAQDRNALELLTGSPLPAELIPGSLSEKITALQDITPGLSSEVLLERPDILQAEGQLKAANANIGAAEAAFFPKITLVSSVGLGSDELFGLFKGGALTWNFAPKISLPIFDGGSLKANLQVSMVDRDIAVARYEKAIQTAFREVADALAQRAVIDEQLAAQLSLTTASEESHRIAQARFDKGVDSYLPVLDAQRALYSARQNLITTRLTRLANQVTLYKALGGGDTPEKR